MSKQTPHRLTQELYDHFIAYGRGYADSIPTCTPINDGLASANLKFGSALQFHFIQVGDLICSDGAHTGTGTNGDRG